MEGTILRPVVLSASLVPRHTAGKRQCTLIESGSDSRLNGTSAIAIEADPTSNRVCSGTVLYRPYAEWVTEGAWHTVVLSWDEGVGTDALSLWVDGILVKTVTVDIGDAEFIAFGPTGASSVGKVDDVIVYGRSMPPALVRSYTAIGPNGAQLNREYCDSLDNDCDGLTDEDESGWGIGEATSGASCETLDADVCQDGVWRCVEGNGLRVYR